MGIKTHLVSLTCIYVGRVKLLLILILMSKKFIMMLSDFSYANLEREWFSEQFIYCGMSIRFLNIVKETSTNVECRAEMECKIEFAFTFRMIFSCSGI